MVMSVTYRLDGLKSVNIVINNTTAVLYLNLEMGFILIYKSVCCFFNYYIEEHR